MTEKASSVRFVPERKPFKHAGENAADEPIEVVRVELKASPQSKPCDVQ
jgi:hypothetical protein